MVGNPKDIITDNSSAATAPSNAKNCKSPGKSSVSMNAQAQIDVALKLKKKLQKEIQHNQKSIFEVPGYSNHENIWQKIMDIRTDNKIGKRSSRMNTKVNERIVRCKNCFYSPFE